MQSRTNFPVGDKRGEGCLTILTISSIVPGSTETSVTCNFVQASAVVLAWTADTLNYF